MTDKHDLNGDKHANKKHWVWFSIAILLEEKNKAYSFKIKTIFSLNSGKGVLANWTDNPHLREEAEADCPWWCKRDSFAG